LQLSCGSDVALELTQAESRKPEIRSPQVELSMVGRYRRPSRLLARLPCGLILFSQCSDGVPGDNTLQENGRSALRRRYMLFSG
jgi:hypothetical protein